MENNIPVPTDNIFKFYALFGLLLFIFSLGASLYTTSTTNELILGSIPELEGLKQIEKPSRVEEAKIAVIDKKLEVAKSNRKFFSYVLGGLETDTDIPHSLSCHLDFNLLF